MSTYPIFIKMVISHIQQLNPITIIHVESKIENIVNVFIKVFKISANMRKLLQEQSLQISTQEFQHK